MRVYDLFEKFEFEVQTPWAAREAKIYKNPRYEEIQMVFKKAELPDGSPDMSHKQLKGFVAGPSVYIWDAALANHFDVKPYMPEGEQLVPFLYFESSGYSMITPVDSPVTRDELMAHPMVAKMMSKKTLGHNR